MSFDETILNCGAPALCGIKPASLFSMNGDCYKTNRIKLIEWRTVFCKAQRFLIPIKKEDNRILFFIYDKNLLQAVLADKKNLAYLREKGYPVENGFNSILSELIHRLAVNRDFPHEVGLFLGYPLVDVIGFESDSSAFKYSGFWKVYGDRNEAVKQMMLYKTCTKVCMANLGKGMSVPLAAKEYIKGKPVQNRAG